MGRFLSGWRNLVCVTMAMMLPASLLSQNLDTAMLHAAGPVRINGSIAPAASAIFADDLIETTKTSQAKIDTSGSTAVLGPDTLVQFEENELFLEHGNVQVTTSTQMTVRVGCITAIPVIMGWTQYDVTDVDGKVLVVAHRKDVDIASRKKADQRAADTDHQEKATVRQGEQATRSEKCGAAIRVPDYVDANKALLDRWQPKVAGIILIGVIACLGICLDDDPVSPSTPSDYYKPST
ncbi:MAG TPA: hypothetical protein VI386_31560 [Candidatus Sulfotelmatobacter sp.]